MEIKVCDTIMGSGKTESAITLMNTDASSRYIFITPYLNEVERIKRSCEDRHFVSPRNFGEGKLSNLHQLLENGVNIASTHALFKAYSGETLRLLREQNYKLILDEVFSAVENIEIHKDDIQLLLGNGVITCTENSSVRWEDYEYNGDFSGIKEKCLAGDITLHQNHLMLWTFPIEIFKAFDDVIILTYLFNAQIQKYYFDMNGIKLRQIGTLYERGQYHFCDYPTASPYVKELKKKIHIVDNKKLNAIGDDNFALSASWYRRAIKSQGQPQIKVLKNNLFNFFHNIAKSPSGQNLWTSFKDYQKILTGKGYTNGFLSYNTRATNEHRKRNCLAYCVNVFFNPFMKNYFLDYGVDVKEDVYALSEMVQWIWRSAIRDGEEIWVYIPSSRMRTLLEKWLDDLADGGNNGR